MSLHPEYHRVEAQQMLRPHLVLVTNFRVDHVEAQGPTQESVAETLALDVPPGATALVPEEEWEPRFQELVEKAGGRVVKVPAGEGPTPRSLAEFGTNRDLVWAAARSLGVEEDTIREGVGKAQGDLGKLRVWRYGPQGISQPWLVVSAFAANDPESTFRIQDRILAQEGMEMKRCIGLLSLRADRGDRTLQWAEALTRGGLDRFGTLLVVGRHARALLWRLGRAPGAGKVRLLRPTHAYALMKAIDERCGSGSGPGKGARLLFGFGNIGGLGEDLVRHWEREGEPHGI
jgi:hypothetical protein